MRSPTSSATECVGRALAGAPGIMKLNPPKAPAVSRIVVRVVESYLADDGKMKLRSVNQTFYGVSADALMAKIRNLADDAPDKD